MWIKAAITASVSVIPFIVCAATYALQCALRPPQPPFEHWMRSNGYSIYIVTVVLTILTLAALGVMTE